MLCLIKLLLALYFLSLSVNMERWAPCKKSHIQPFLASYDTKRKVKIIRRPDGSGEGQIQAGTQANKLTGKKRARDAWTAWDLSDLHPDDGTHKLTEKVHTV